MTGAAAFGASSLSLALLGLGLPFAAASLVASACAGLLIYALGRWALARAALRPAEQDAGPPEGG